MDLVMRPWAGTPQQWIIVFDRSCKTQWVNRMPIGKYKHVRAFGYVAEAQAWIFYDVSLYDTSIFLACDAHAKALIKAWLADADAIGMPALPPRRAAPRLGFWCVQAVKHLIGLRSGALRPDTLWRDCLANGGEIVANGLTQPTAAPGAGSAAHPAAAASAG